MHGLGSVNGSVRPLAERHREPAHQLRSLVFTGRRTSYDETADREHYIPLERRLGAFDGDRLVGHLGVWPMGQWYGGRCAPMGGVAGVAVLPEYRGRGVASALLEASLTLMRDLGDVISTLYPANLGLYRLFGWELAGTRPHRSVPTAALAGLPRPDESVEVREAGPSDLPVMVQLYDRVARTQPGMLRRPAAYVGRLTDEREGHRAYLAHRDDDVAGYIWWEVTAGIEDEAHGIDVHEVVATDLDALLALWRLMGSNRPMTRRLRYVGAPTDPLALLLADDDPQPAGRELWMSRLVDAPGAVAARGFPPAISARVDLAVEDPTARWNDGAFVLEVADGSGRLTAGGSGRVRASAGSLAALFSGWAAPADLAALGLLTGAAADDLAALHAAFTGQTPWMRDYF